MALKNFSQFSPQTVLSATDYMVGYRDLDEIRTTLDSLTIALSGLLTQKGFTPGNSLGSVARLSYRYTITSNNPVNAVSGTDDFGLNLAYVPGLIEVYRNGSHLVESLDYRAINGTQITNLSTLNLGDIVEVSGLSGVVATRITETSSGGSVFFSNYRYTVATGNTIVPGATLVSGSDDYNAVLNFTAPNLEVYLNGSHLVRDYDYGLYSTGSSFTLAAPVANGDVLDVVALSGFGLTVRTGVSAYSNITRIVAGKNISISPTTGTGVVTVSSKTSLDDIPVPGWTNRDHITKWSTLQYYLSAVAETNTSPASAVYGERFGSVPSGFKGYNLTLAPNGKIYCFGSAPGGSNTFAVVIDPNSNSVSSFGIASDNNGFAQGVLAPNGKIYLIGYNDTLVRVIDPSNNTISSIGTLVGTTANNKYLGGVLASNGKIYTVPYNSTVVQVIDPNSGTISSFGTLPINSTSSVLVNSPLFFNGAVLAPNGKIYCIPDGASYFWFIDPDTNSITSFATMPVYAGGNGYNYKGALAINGKIYTGPGARSIIFIIDPETNSVSQLTTVNFFGFDIRLFPNGKLYMHGGGHSVATFFTVLDPVNNTITTGINMSLYTGYQSAFGCIVAPNGKVYYGNYNATQFLAIAPLNKNNWNINVCTNPLVQMGGPTG